MTSDSTRRAGDHRRTVRSRRCLAAWASCIVLAAGCHHGIRVNMVGDVTTRLPPDHSSCPVHQRVVAGHPCECGKVAIIDIDGMLLNRNFQGLGSAGENPVALFHEKLMAAGRDPNVRAVVLRINSPGGSVTASDMMRHQLTQFRAQAGKPVIASILDVGAGGAYYLATACDAITAHPTSVVGGVGVIINIYNLADTMEQQNVEATPVRAGDHIDLGSPVARLSADGRAILKAIATELHGRFIDAVVESRPGVERTNLDGRVFTATAARDRGFIDDVAYLDDAIDRARALGGLGSQSRVVMFRRGNDRALTEFDITPNTPVAVASLPLSIPGLDRASLPHFLYLWQPEPGLESAGY